MSRPPRRKLVEKILDGDPFLTTEEVAAIFVVDQQTVSRWAAAGRLKGQKSPGGRDWRFRESDVRAALAEGGLS